MSGPDDVKAQFRKYDKSGHGKLSRHEMSFLLQTLNPKLSASQLSLVFKCFSINSDGMLAIDDFVDYLFETDQQPRAGREHEEFLGVSVHHLRTTFLTHVYDVGLDGKAKVYDLEPTVIRPLSKDQRCPRDSRMGAAYVDVLQGNQHVGAATLMLSYTWGYAIGDIVETLTQYCADRVYHPEETYIWMCCLCINQHRVKEAQALGQTVPFETFEKEFGDRVRGIGQVVAMMSPWHEPSYLKRVWCDFEMFTAVAMGKAGITIVMPPEEMDDFRAALLEKTGIDRVWRACTGVRVEAAQASVEEDRQNILRMIRDGPGYQKMNCVIVEHLQKWMIDCSEIYFRQHLHDEEMDTNTKLRLCMTVNKMLRTLGYEDRAFSLLEEALQIHERAGTLQSWEGAELLAQMGILRRRDRDYAGAAELFSKACRIHEHLETLETDKGALLILNIAIVHREQGDAVTALHTLHRAKDLAMKANVWRTNIGALILRNTAHSKEDMGDHDGAHADYAEALQIYKETDSFETPPCASLMEKIGRLQLRSRNLADALDWFAKARSVRERTNTLRSEEGAKLLKSHGDALRSSGDLSGAMDLYMQARAIYEKRDALATQDALLLLKTLAELKPQS